MIIIFCRVAKILSNTQKMTCQQYREHIKIEMIDMLGVFFVIISPLVLQIWPEILPD